MTRPRVALRLSGIGFVIVAVLAATGATTLATSSASETAGGSPPASPPNIVLVLTDDLDLQLHSLDYMPNLQRLLAEEGMTFTSNFVPLSLCCPSRTTILTGQFPHNHQVLTNRPPSGGFERAYALNLESSTTATLLHDAGYRTVLLGKYLNGYPDTASPTYVPPGWDEWYSPVAGNPYSEYNYTLNENGTPVSYGASPADYLTDVIFAKAVDFILRTSRSPAQPFFIYFSTYAPHGPSTPAPRHANLFPTVKAPRPPSFNEADVSDKPAYIRSKPPLTRAEVRDIDARYRLRLQSLQAVDEAIAGLVAALEGTGQLARTFILFTSDNGFHMGEHRLRSGKYTPYETDIEVPLVVRGPGVPAKAISSQLTGSLDLAATFAGLAGVSAPPSSDGRSLVPLLFPTPALATAPAPRWRQAILLEQFSDVLPAAGTATTAEDTSFLAGTLEPPDTVEELVSGRDPGHLGFRTSTYSYVEYATGEKELYLLTLDPFQLDNRAGKLSRSLAARLSAYLHRLSTCAGEGCRAADAENPPPLLEVYDTGAI